MNEFIISGILTDIGSINETGSGIKVLNFTVRHERPSGKGSKKEDLLRITAFRELAEDVAVSRPGERILVKGRIQDNNYTKDDRTYYALEPIAETIMKLA